MNLIEELSGEWIYRSFRNRVEPVQSLEEILFGEGDLSFSVSADGYFQDGKLSFGEDYLMIVKGQAVKTGEASFSFPPVAIEMKAFGVAETPTAGWLYEYRGYLVPEWVNGEEQKTVLVGSVIRTVAHGERSTAGFVASFIAVKK